MPGAKSTIERHPERLQIEARIRKGDALTHIARDFDLSRQAVSRAKVKLLSKPAGQGDDGREEMLRQVRGLYNQVTDLVRSAKAANHPRAFLASVAEARRCLNLLSKIIGLLNEPAAAAPVSVVVNVDIEQIQQVVLTALAPFPKARQAVASALIAHDGRAGEREQE